MKRTAYRFWALVLLTCFAQSAKANAIDYTTEGSAGSLVRFEGTSGSLQPRSPISLGKLVIDAAAAGSITNISNESFLIALRTPAFDQPVPAGPTSAPYPTTIESSVLIRGHLSGVIRDGAPAVVATFDSVELGGLGPYLQGHVQRFSFPIPVADVKLPAYKIALFPTDDWDGTSSRSVELTAQIVPEPAAWAAWGLAALIGVIARCGATRSSRVRRPT